MPKEYCLDNGIKILLYSIGEVAKRVRRTTRTLYKWEKAGYMPKATFKHNGIRLYSEQQIQAIKNHIKTHHLASGKTTDKTQSITF